MDIRIYNFDFQLLTVAKDVISSSWSLRYNGVGTYEGHFKLNSETASVILRNRYLVLTEGEKQAVCTGKIAGDELVFCGRTVNWLLGKRVIPPFKTSVIFGEYVSPEDILWYVLEKGFLKPPQIDTETGEYIADSIDTDRQVKNFRLCERRNPAALSRHFWRLSANTVLELTQDLTEMMEVGHTLVFNPTDKTWDFSYITGTERKLLLAEDFKTAYNTEYTEDFLEFASGGWYETANADETEQCWNYLKRENAPTGMYYWDAALSGNSQAEAQASLAKRQSISTAALDTAGIRYGEDYALGDIITIGIQKGDFRKKLRARVTGVNMWRMYDDSGEEPVLSILE